VGVIDKAEKQEVKEVRMLWFIGIKILFNIIMEKGNGYW